MQLSDASSMCKTRMLVMTQVQVSQCRRSFER